MKFTTLTVNQRCRTEVTNAAKTTKEAECPLSEFPSVTSKLSTVYVLSPIVKAMPSLASDSKASNCTEDPVTIRVVVPSPLSSTDVHAPSTSVEHSSKKEASSLPTTMS